jgi:hypothetical protein
MPPSSRAPDVPSLSSSLAGQLSAKDQLGADLLGVSPNSAFGWFYFFIFLCLNKHSFWLPTTEWFIFH